MQSQSGLVSIIIPCFNASETIELCLRSCLQQTWHNLEIIVVDNNCTDDTMSIVEETLGASNRPYQTLDCKAQGVTHARNRGFEAAGGDYIQWLDADDTLGAEKIERQVSVLAGADEVDIAYGDWRWNMAIDPRASVSAIQNLRRGVPAIAYGPKSWRPHPEVDSVAFNDYQLSQWDDYLLRLLEDKWAPPNSYLIKRAIADKLHGLPGWNPQTSYADDREYFTCAALLGARFDYVAGAIAEYNTWSETQTTRRASSWERVVNLARIFERWCELADTGKTVDLSPDHRFLLEQNRDLWALPRASIGLGETDRRAYFVVKPRTGAKHLVTGVEAAAIAVMTSNQLALTLEDHAKLIANRVSRLWESHLTIMHGLERLRSLDVLEPQDIGS